MKIYRSQTDYTKCPFQSVDKKQINPIVEFSSIDFLLGHACFLFDCQNLGWATI